MKQLISTLLLLTNINALNCMDSENNHLDTLNPILRSALLCQISLRVAVRNVTCTQLDGSRSQTISHQNIYRLGHPALPGSDILFSLNDLEHDSSFVSDYDLALFNETSFEPITDSKSSKAIKGLVQRMRKLGSSMPDCAKPEIFTQWILEKHYSLHRDKFPVHSYDRHYALEFLRDLKRNEAFVLERIQKRMNSSVNDGSKNE